MKSRICAGNSRSGVRGKSPIFKKNLLSVATGIAATVLVAGMGISQGAFAAKGGIPGKPEGPGEETAGNNLSTPAVLTSVLPAIPARWNVLSSPELGVHYSYGCDVPQSVDQFNYPNTSCVDDLSSPTEYLDAAACVAPGAPCDGESVSRIYWQKVADNDWSADQVSTGEVSEVAYVDWGDALEAVSWNERSVVRVETQPYSSRIPGFDPEQSSCEDAADAAAEDDCRVGLQMWHVSGQGTNEQWGVRAADSDGGDSFNYDSPFEIINSTKAFLNLAKMVPEDAECKAPGGGDEEEPTGEDPPTNVMGVWDGSKWTNACTWYNAPYSVELSVGGKYVYGYNWRMKSVTDLESLCGPGWLKTGYWRLTFYSPDDIDFTQFLGSPEDADYHNVAPPASPGELRSLPRQVFNTELKPIPAEPPEDDRLYAPVVDTENNLTYIDICITAKAKGGGGGGGGKPDDTPGGGKPQ